MSDTLEHKDGCPEDPSRVEIFTSRKPITRKTASQVADEIGYERIHVRRCCDCGAAIYRNDSGRVAHRER